MAKNYLCFTAEAAGSTIILGKTGSPLWTGSYSLDGDTWIEYIPETTGAITLTNVGNKVYFKGIYTAENSSFQYLRYSMTGKIAASGNIMSLCSGDDFENVTTIPYSMMFYALFEGCESLTTPPILPATVLADSCYYAMFLNCTSLTTAPELPATTLTEYCYAYIFDSCESLISAPTLPATTLAKNCYESMFCYCTSLTTAPSLPATVLADYCYCYMFSSCESLTTAPALPATTLAHHCYHSMFSNCPSLVTIPALPAITLTICCYKYMFYGSTKIKLSTTKDSNYTQAYRIPISGTGTTATSALEGMFYYTVGVFSGEPKINTTYYLHKDCSIVWPKKNYLCLTAEQDNSTIQLIHSQGNWKGSYSFDQITWHDYILDYDDEDDFWRDGPVITLKNSGDKIYFKGIFTQLSAPEDDNIHFTMTGKIAASGNIMSFCYEDDFEGQLTIPWEGIFHSFFSGCSVLTTPPELPATTLTEACYAGMFSGCSGLTTLPQLPALNLLWGVYDSIFANCGITISKTIDENHKYPYRIPSVGTGTSYYEDGETDAFWYQKWNPDNFFKVNTLYYLSLPFGFTWGIQSENDIIGTKYANGTYAGVITAAKQNEFCDYCSMLKYGIKGQYNRYKVPQGAIMTAERYNWMVDMVAEACNRIVDKVVAKETIITANHFLWLSGEAAFSKALCLTAQTKNAQVRVQRPLTSDLLWTGEYSYNGKDWFACELQEGSISTPYYTLTNIGDTIYFRGSFSEGPDSSDLTALAFAVRSGSLFNISGNIMSLCYNDDFENKLVLPSYDNIFGGLFLGSGFISAAKLKLPATTLTYDCYNGMFAYSNTLTTPPVLPATNLATWCYTDMFKDCTALTVAPNLPATELAYGCYYCMFGGCTSLKTAPTLPAEVIGSGSYYYMFNGCSKLNKITVNFNTWNNNTLDWVKNVASTGVFSGPEGLEKIVDDSHIPYGWIFSNEQKDLIYWKYDTDLNILYLNNAAQDDTWTLLQYTDGYPNWQTDSNLVTTVTKVKILNDIYPSNCQYWFYEMVNLTSIENFGKIKTEYIESLKYMFYNCKKLNSLTNFSGKITDVTDISYMFYNCKLLTSIDLSKISFKDITNAEGLFEGCLFLEDITFNDFNDRNTVASFTNISRMFMNCKSLIEITLPKYFSSTEITNISHLFDGCENLTSINLDNLISKKITDSSYLFNNNLNLSSLSLNNLSTNLVVNMSYMFANCLKLKHIYVSYKWTTKSVTSSENMFLNSSLLPNFNVNYVNKTYAYIYGYLNDGENMPHEQENIYLNKIVGTGIFTSISRDFASSKNENINIYNITAIGKYTLTKYKSLYDNTENISISSINGEGLITFINYQTTKNIENIYINNIHGLGLLIPIE